MESQPVYHSPVPQGKTIRITSETQSLAGTKAWTFTTDADAVLVSLYVQSTSGDLDVSVYTQTEEGRDLLIASFPTVSAPTMNLLLKKGAQVINQIKIVATWTDAVIYEIYARGVSASESSVKILGSSDASASQQSIPAVATLIIPAAITDRAGLILKNNNGVAGASLYIGFTSAEANLATGYPITAQESLGMDLSSGVEVWGISSAGTTDVRILQAGG